MIKIFDEARGYLRDKRYNLISPRMIDVDAYNVILQVKAGRSIPICSCSGSSRFTDSNLCSHKAVLIGLNLNIKLYNEIEKAIEQATIWKNLNFKIEPQLILDMLNKIKAAK